MRIENLCMPSPCYKAIAGFTCFLAITIIALSIIGLTASPLGPFNAIVAFGATTNKILLGISIFALILDMVWSASLYKKTKDGSVSQSNPSELDLPNPQSPKQESSQPALVTDSLSPEPQVNKSVLTLPDTLPEIIPERWDIRGKQWIKNTQLHLYIVYLATQYPQMAIQQEENQFHATAKTVAEGLFEEWLPQIEKDYGKDNVPIYLQASGNHWVLVYIDRQMRTVEYYDSKTHYGNYNEIVIELKKIAESLSLQDPHPKNEPYEFIGKILRNDDNKLQPDSWECGIWVLWCLKKRLKNPNFNFSKLNAHAGQKKVADFRIKVQKTLLKLIEIEEAAYAKAQAEYIKVHKDPQKAEDKFFEDVAKIPYITRWKQIFDGSFLVTSRNSI